MTGIQFEGMSGAMRQAYDESRAFWDRGYARTEEELNKMAAEVNPEDWRKLAPSEKQLQAILELGACRRVLDYGCGRGWGGVIAAKGGCRHVTLVEVAKNSVPMAQLTARVYGVEDCCHVHHIDTRWLSMQPSGSYDGLFCSNVLDVIPTEVSDDIIRHAARVLAPGGRAVISLNYYMDPEKGTDPERNREVRDGKYLFQDGILRLVCRTDEAWAAAFAPYFDVERLEHYAWPTEETKRRRLFILRRR